MENYLSDHPHLLKALGLTKTLPSNDAYTEINLQPDLDTTNSPDKAEDPKLDHTSTSSSTAKPDSAQADETSSTGKTNGSDSDVPPLPPENPEAANSDNLDKNDPNIKTLSDGDTQDKDKKGLNTKADIQSDALNLNGNTQSGDDKPDDVSTDFLVVLAL